MTKPCPPSIDLDHAAALIEPLTQCVARAAAAILAVDRAGMRLDGKIDGSPVTEADLAADHILRDCLAQLAPHIPVVSEERVAATEPPHVGSFFLVDPLDGTKEFIAGRSEFTVNLALVTDGTPLVGIIGAPALGLTWRGLVGRGAERLSTGTGKEGQTTIQIKPIHARPLPAVGQPWIAAVSRSHGDARTDAFINARPGAVRRTLGSAVKFAGVAEGTIDIYPRLAPTHEWDVAAGHAIVTAAGGKVTDPLGAELRFGGRFKDFVIPAFIAWGDPAAAG
jgi:3'(2'), 5'-bisphosphate nucleotidase